MSFKVIILVAVAACANAGHLGGKSVTNRQQDGHGNYAFDYQIVDHLGATNGRSEKGTPHGVVGSYNIADIDGRVRRVDYVADHNGFRAKVHTNEPGTAPSLPAAAVIDSPHVDNIAVGPALAGPVYAGGYGGYPGYGGYGLGNVGYGYY